MRQADNHDAAQSSSEASAESLDRLLRFLGGDGDGGVAYEALRRRLSSFFRYKGHTDPDARTDEAFDRVARKLTEGEAIGTSVPSRYVLGVARMVHLEAAKHEIRARRALERPEPPPPDRDEQREADAQRAALQACLQALLDAERDLILRYHTGRGQARIDARRALAAELGVTVNSLRIRAFRIRERLESCTRGRLS